MGKRYGSEKITDSRKLTVYYHYAGNKSVPLIRLQGYWLENLGFKIGECIEVNYDSEKGEILIKRKE